MICTSNHSKSQYHAETFELTCLSGSLLLSRFHTYQSEYLSALAFLDIGYLAPGTDFNISLVDAFNNVTQAQIGYPTYGYWYYFNQPDSHVLLDGNVSTTRFYSSSRSLQH